VLRRMSNLSEFWKSIDAAELSRFARLRVLFDGIKIKLLSRLLYLPGLFVYACDYVNQKLAGADLSPITSKINPVWLLAGSVGIGILIDIARSYSGSPVTTDDHLLPPAKV
jgi:hypothetical protein